MLVSDYEYLDGMSLGEALDFVTYNYDTEETVRDYKVFESTDEDSGRRTLSLGALALFCKVSLAGKFAGRKVHPLRDCNARKFVYLANLFQSIPNESTAD